MNLNHTTKSEKGGWRIGRLISSYETFYVKTILESAYREWDLPALLELWFG
jgi:hypothetical protein